MNIIQMYNYLGGLALSFTNVNHYHMGDPYEGWNEKELKYASVTAAIESVDETETMRYFNVLLYYGDRLVEGDYNAYSIQSEGVRILQDIVKTIREDVGIDTDYELSYIPFRQQFADNLAGAYVRIRISEASEMCADE